MAAIRHASVTNTPRISTVGAERPTQTGTAANSSNVARETMDRRSSFLMIFLRSLSAPIA